MAQSKSDGRKPDIVRNSIGRRHVAGCMSEQAASRREITRTLPLLAVVLLVLVTACAGGEAGPPDEPATAEPPAVTRADPFATYDPVRAGETLPDGYRQLLARDQIAPIYDPVFTSPSQVDWPGDMLVIGIAGESEAKAYPVTHLNQREMVIDSLEGIPVLVTW